jgi:hypothetical protein
MNQNEQIALYFLLFLIIISLYYFFFIHPKKLEEEKNKERREQLIQFMEKEKNEDPAIAIKSSQSIHNPKIDFGNHLPSETHDMKIEDSFSDAYRFDLGQTLASSPKGGAYNIPKSEYENLVESSVPTLNTYQCWLSKEFECPPKDGNYLQCTNNYIPKPKQKNCDCSNRTFEMCPFPYKISENEYYKKIGFNREKEFGY